MARNNETQSEIQSLVESFTSQLTVLVRRSAIQQVQQALGGMAATGEGAATRTRTVRVVRMGRGARRSAGGKRSPEAVAQMGETLFTYIKDNPGQRGEQIAKALRTDVKTMRLPIQKLIAGKKVKTRGQRRGTTYFAA